MLLWGGELQCHLPNTNALVAVRKSKQAVKLCFNKILKFLLKIG